MSSKKVVSASSLMRLCNGCCSRNVGNCIKSHNMLRTMCTAVERWDFQFSGGYQAVDSYQQNQAGFHQQNAGGYQAVDSYQQNQAGFHQQNAGGYQAVDSYQQNQAGFHQQNAGGSYQNNHASSEQISYGSGHSASGRHINIPQNVAQNNLAGHNGSVSADFGQSNLKVHHKVGVGVDDSRGVGTHPNAFYEKHNWRLDSGEKIKYPNAYSLPRPLEYQGQKGNLTQNTGRFQQAPNDYYTRSNETGQQYSAYRQSQQCLVDGPYTPNLNTTQKPMVGSPLSSSAKPDGVSFEASNDGPYRGTLEELDSFYVEGKVKEAVEVLQVLEKLHVPVGLDRCVQLMHQCGKTKSLEEAKVVHRHALQHFSPLKVSTCNIILEMYFECGSEDDALKVFKNMPERDLTTWCTMIKQLTKNGFAEDSIDLFTEFKSLGLKPDGQIFIAVFSACSMLGDVDEGMLHFESMSKDYGIVPSMAHYVSVVDMIGGIGHLDEALEFIEKMPLEPSADVWETLMNMCRVHGNTELGDRCTELIEKLDPTRLNEKSKTGLLLEENPDSTKNKEQNKLASKNLLEVRSRIHEYRAGDTSHPENDKIYALLRGLRVQMKEAGYIPETKFVLHDIDLESKEDALLAHSERLAVAYGLLNSSARSPIRVIKNLRVCGDCHTALKIISELVGRELIIRDAKRFHHFKNGLCSCRDYW